MLSYLRVRGLALLDDVTIELDPHLNVLTGETGAGKSIIVDALTVLRGAKMRADIVRAGSEAAVVDAQFELDAKAAEHVGPLLADHGISEGDDPRVLVVKRSIPRTGRGRIFINGQLTTREILAEIAAYLIDICSQHEHHSLTQVSRHIELLDAFAGQEALLERYAETYGAYREAVRTVDALARTAQEAGTQADFLKYQITELERVAPEPGEYERLHARFTLLRESQRWVEFAALSEQLLENADDSVRSRLGRLIDLGCRGKNDSPRLAAITDLLSSAEASVTEALSLIERFVTELEILPGELEQVEERLSELATLRRKHGGELDDLAARLDAMRTELEGLVHTEERLAAAERERELRLAAAIELAERLRAARRASVRKLASAIEHELAGLSLKGARFEPGMQVLDPKELGPRGLDRVEFLFSANPGEPLAPLSRVASGGELSRVLLALRGIVAGEAGVATYVFDEVDAGLGGAVAEGIGQRLARAARSSQVLCITHLPQVAAFATAHLRVDKQLEGGRTTTRVTRLDERERIEELARMLGGARVTQSARDHAAQLVDDARRVPSPKRPTAAGTKSPKKSA